MKTKCYIFDIDHTLSMPVKRWPYDSCEEDEKIQSIDLLILALNVMKHKNPDAYDIKIIILSGRKEKYHLRETKKWLAFNLVWYDELILNDTDPCVKGHEFKKIKLDELKKKYNILGVFDDELDVHLICTHLWIPSFLFSHNYE